MPESFVGTQQVNRFVTYGCLFCAVLIHLAILSASKTYIYSRAPDFAPLYAAGKVLLIGRAWHLYDREPRREAPPKIPDPKRGTIEDPDTLHPPFEILIYAPLAVLPYPAAFVLWFCVNSALVINVPIAIRRQLPRIGDALGLVVLMCATFFPAILTMLQGQDSIVLLFLTCGLFVALSKRRDALAGLLLSLTMFKFQIALALLVGLAALRGRRFLRGFLAGCGVLLIVSVCMVGFHGVLQYLKGLIFFSQLPAGNRAVYPWMMPNLNGFIEFAFRGTAPVLRTTMLVILTSGLLTLQFWLGRHFRRQDEALPLLFSLFVIIAVIVPFHEFLHDLAVLLLPLCLASNHVAAHSRPLMKLPLVIGGLGIWIVPYLAYAAGTARPILGAVLLLGATFAFQLVTSARRAPAPQSA